MTATAGEARLAAVLQEVYGPGAAGRVLRSVPSRPTCQVGDCPGDATIQLSTDACPTPLWSCAWCLGVALTRGGVGAGGTVRIHQVLPD